MYHSSLGDFASREAEEFYLNVLRRMTPDQKWRAAAGLWEVAIELACAGVRADHPDWTQRQVRSEVARRTMELNGTARFLVSGH